MESSSKIIYMVAIFMFFIEARPLQPYLTAYLTGPNGNVTLSEVANSMESIKSYSAVTVTLIMLIISDYLLYKAVIIILTCNLLITNILMAGSPSLTQLRVSMAFLGSSYSTTTLASCYLFAQIEDTQQYQMSASLAAVGLEFGKFFGDVSGQIIVSASGGSYAALPYYNAFTMFLAVIWALLFPPIKQKYFIKTNMSNEKTWLLENYIKTTPQSHDNKQHANILTRFGYWYFYNFSCLDNSMLYKKCNIMIIVFKQTWSDFKLSFSDIIIQKKTLWYVFGMAAYVQITTNINILYSYVVNEQGNNDVISNGFAESMVTLCGALGAYLIGKVQLDWTYYGNVFTAFCSILMGLLMMSCYFYNHLLFIYLSYMLYGLLNEAVLVVTLFEIGKHIKNQCYSLVLGINLLGSLVISAIMTLFFVQFNFLDITVPGRFLYIGGLYIILGIIFLILNLFEDDKKKTVY